MERNTNQPNWGEKRTAMEKMSFGSALKDTFQYDRNKCIADIQKFTYPARETILWKALYKESELPLNV
ncbi:hypothetical protein QMK38_13030 [Lysinibacillus fusiformis]|nr:hypothetical protein [Lysinibacillus fusiformis]